jgi:UDP-2-acetamido-3-amino-2,3-dideoxy-glucuronate N-acetyltransferase
MTDRTGVHITALIHPLAHIDQSLIGAHTRVWQFASVIRNSRIGEECRIASTAIIDGGVLGNRVLVGHGSFIGPGIIIGDDVFIGPNCTLCNDAWPRTDKAGFDIEKLLSGDFVTVHIETGASLGAGSIVLPGVIVGCNAMVAAGSIVSNNVAADHLHKRSGHQVRIAVGYPKSRMRAID